MSRRSADSFRVILFIGAILLHTAGCSEARPPQDSTHQVGGWSETSFVDSLRTAVSLLDEVTPILSELSRHNRSPSPEEIMHVVETLRQAEDVVPTVPWNLSVLEFPNHHVAAGNIEPSIRSFEWAMRRFAGELDLRTEDLDEPRFHLRQGLRSMERVRGALESIQNTNAASPATQRLDSLAHVA
jgi:hypothetical protein